MVDVAVVGAGLAGSAAAYALRGYGAAVALVEARAPGHTAGSSHGSARIFRRAYPDPLYVELAGRAGEGWRRISAAAGEELVHRTGGIDFGSGRDPVALAEVMRAAGVPVEVLTARAAAARWPGFAFDGPVAFHAEAGVLDPDR